MGTFILKTEEKKYLINLVHKSYLYRFYAILFSAVGLAIFGYIYFNYIQTNLIEALQRPVTVLTFVVPFLPGAFLAFKAEKLQLKARKIIHDEKRA